MKKDQTKPTENVPAQFEKFDRANKGKDVPNSGYVQEAANATARGRAIIAAGKRGERNFPPAWQVVKP